MAALLVLLVALLAMYAFTHQPPGENGTIASGRGVTVPPRVLAGGPVIDAPSGRPGRRIPPGVVALTFDDGPGPYTAKVLDVLERYHVPATFFVIGANVAGHTNDLRRMVADGDEIGVHTFSHPDLGTVPAWREHLELNATQLTIASATGYLTDLMRLPYSSLVRDITPGQWLSVLRAGSYRVVFATLDTRDWARPGAARIAERGVPSDGHGAVVMLHDGGGNRQQTVAALRLLIPRLRALGYRFDTVSHAVGLSSPWTVASLGQRWRGAILLAFVGASHWLVIVLQWLFVLTGVLALLRTLLLLAFARRHARGTGPSPEFAPPVSVVVPAYNESVGIERCVRSLHASNYPDLEILVVDDGSTDNTAQIVRDLALPRVQVISQPNAGKPNALTTGIRIANNDILVLVDGDTIFEADSVRELVAPLANTSIGAVSGNTKVGNRKGIIGRWQHVEYVIGFNLDRRMFDVLECMPTVPGAIGAFRRTTLDAVGGVSDDTLAEDTDLTMAICRSGWRVVYAPRARAWTEAPAGLGALWRQRYRWCYGTLQAMWKHRHAWSEHGAAGRFGRRGLTYLLLFQTLLPLLAPVVDLATIAGALSGRGWSLLFAWLAFLALQLLGAIYAFRLDRERYRTLWVLPLQQFVYRQLMYLVVLHSIASAAYGIRLRWHKLERTGQLEDAPASV